MDRRVYLSARVRPLTPREVSMGSKACIVVDGNCTTLVNPETGDAKAFVLDHSFDSSDPADRSGKYADNYTIFTEIGSNMLASVLDGFNTCLFAHGQPQTGKTHTLIGQESDPGLLPRLLEALFQQDAVINGHFRVLASFYELLNEQVRDVLRRDFYTPGGLKVRMRSDGSGSDVEGLSKVTLTSMKDCEDFLAQVLRCMGGIAQGAHAIFSLELYSAQEAGGEMRPYAKVHLVDLAGSSAGATDIVTNKAQQTPQDKSLLAWANVMSALAENQMMRVKGGKGNKVFVPYRGSVLTRILEDSMAQRSRSFVVANLSPSHLSYKETLNTFRHIVRTKEVKKVARNDELLNAYLGETDFIPAAGGGWRWAYCTKVTDDSQSQESLK